MGSGTTQVRRLADFLNYIAGWCLVAMTFLTCADVILRIFRYPILGTYEIVGFLGAATASFAMAHTTIKRGHVAVEVVTTQLSPKAQEVMYLITNVLSIVVFALLAYECYRFGNDLRVNNEVSLTLQIPFFPVLYGMAFSSLTVCLVLIADSFKVWVGGEKPWFEWD